MFGAGATYLFVEVTSFNPNGATRKGREWCYASANPYTRLRSSALARRHSLSGFTTTPSTVGAASGAVQKGSATVVPICRRQDRLLERRHKLARFRDPKCSPDTFDFDFNKKMNRALVYELATARFIAQREGVVFLGPPGTARVISRNRSAVPPFSKATVVYREASSTVKRTRSSKNSPRPRSRAHARTTSPCSKTVPLLIVDSDRYR
jgi:hypothetical protein